MKFVKSLDAATAAGAGTSYSVGPTNCVSFQYKTTGSPTSVSVELQGRLDPSLDWETIGDACTDTSGELIVSGAAVGAREVRMYLNTLSGGTSPTLTAYIGMGS